MQVPVCPELTSAAVVRGLWLRPQPPLMDNSAPFPTRPLALIYRGHSVQTYRATSHRLQNLCERKTGERWKTELIGRRIRHGQRLVGFDGLLAWQLKLYQTVTFISALLCNILVIRLLIMECQMVISDAYNVPRIIFSLWLQGIENAPDIVKLNFARWKQLNPGYTLKILDHDSARKILADVPINIKQLTPQALSDVLRAKLLVETGGIWVDASLFPTLPLDKWLPKKITSSGFFAFEKPGPDRPVSSWFLAATKNNAMVKAWWEQVLCYWATERVAMKNNVMVKPWWKKMLRYWATERVATQSMLENPIDAINRPGEFPYFWFHYLFQLLLESNPKFSQSWNACIKISADAPHAMQIRFANPVQPSPEELLEITSCSPVHKLNWRTSYPLEILSKL